MRTWENFGQPPPLFPADLELFPPWLPDGEDMLGFWYNDLTRAQEGFKVTLVEPWDSYIYYVYGLAGFSSYLVSRLAGTNCIFIWPEARDEGGMRGTYLPLIPRPPPRPNLGRPVWRACCPRDHLGLEGKRMQLHPRSPWGGGVACKQCNTEPRPGPVSL